MKKVPVPRDKRIALVRCVVNAMPEDSIDKKVSNCYMENYCDLDIRIELKITCKNLKESRFRIKQMLLEAADGQLYEIRAVGDANEKFY